MMGARLARGVAVSDDEASRVRLAARPGTPASTLRALAEDECVTVRAAVALNPSFAPAADRRLLEDADERVRALLCGKLAGLLPGLGGREHAAAQAHVHETLMALANDAAVRVRWAIADALTAMPDAPREVILRLAADPAGAVSEPILRLSPLLTDDDLLNLLATPSHESAAAAIASRPGLSSVVADQIAAHADSAAVCALLRNDSAAVQEATLDALVGRAADHPEWHEPLARRPGLSVGAVRSLARFVASHIIDTLAQRPGLPSQVVEELRTRTAAGLDESLGDVPPMVSDQAVLDNIRALASGDGISEAVLLEALEAGSNRVAATMLSVAAGVGLIGIDRAVGLRSAKALISLVWRAGFSMRAGMMVQTLLGKLAPGEVVGPALHGGFPLSDSEMEWQIELLGDVGR